MLDGNARNKHSTHGSEQQCNKSESKAKKWCRRVRLAAEIMMPIIAIVMQIVLPLAGVPAPYVSMSCSYHMYTITADTAEIVFDTRNTTPK